MKKIITALICGIITTAAIAQSWDGRIMYGLKGPVKTVTFPQRTIEFQSGTHSFAKDGTCLDLIKQEKEHEIVVERNSDRRIMKIHNVQGGLLRLTYYYDSAEHNPGAMIGMSYTDDRSSTTWSITYDDQGNMETQSISLTQLPDMKNQMVIATYEVLEKDIYGNWLKRKATMRQTKNGEETGEHAEEIQTCKLTYH